MLASSGYRQRRAGLGSLGWDGVRRAWMDGMRRSLPVGRRRGMGLGAEDRDRGSGGDQLERQSGRALALSGGGGGGGGRDGHGRRELGAGWGLLETCHAGTGLAVRRGTSDRPLIGYPWHPHGTPNQGTHLEKAQGCEQGSERHDSGAFETDRPHMHNGIMDVKESPFSRRHFSALFPGTCPQPPGTDTKWRGSVTKKTMMPVSLGRTLSLPGWAESHLLTLTPKIQRRIIRQAGRNYIMVPTLGPPRGQSAGIS